MMASTVLAFAWTALLVELTPGPNMTYLALLAARRGVSTGLAAVAGVALGLTIIGVAAVTGLAALVDRSPWLYEGIRFAGVGYLLWLALEAWRGAAMDTSQSTDIAAHAAFRDGLVTNLLNPKAAVFYISVLPSFLEPGRGASGQALALAAVYVAIATIVHGVIVLASSRAAKALGHSTIMAWTGQVMGIALAGVALWVFVTTRRSVS